MGASSWDYLVPYQPDLSTALNDLQDQLLASGDFLWREQVWGDRPRPATRAELAAVKEDEDEPFWDEGTHTILDMDRVVPALAGNLMDDTGAISPLSPAEVRECFGTDRPTEEDYLRVRDTALDSMRWTGRCTVLYDPGGQQQILFFGCSGD